MKSFQLRSIASLVITTAACLAAQAKEMSFDDWPKVSANGWRFLDAKASGYEGQVELLEDGSVRVLDDEGGRNVSAELRGDVSFVPSGDCYFIEFDLALLSLGAMDDSTAQHATAHIYFSFNGVGLDLYVSADRLLFDSQWGQYQMLRSSTQHQRFGFLVNTSRKLMRVSVDGRTLGLYHAYDLPEEGVRVTARGSSNLAAEVNVRRITLGDASWDNTPHEGTVNYRPRPTLPAEWPTLLRDPHNTSHSPLKGTSASLEVFNSIPVAGGTIQDVLITDVNRDGAKEIIVQFGGRIRSYDLSGKLLWESRRTGTIIGPHDLDGDGCDEIVLNPLVALDGLTGADKYVVTDESEEEPVHMGCWQFVELPIDLYPQPEEGSPQIVPSLGSPDKCLCAIFFLVGSDTGYVYRFPSGQRSGRREIEFHIAAAATNFNPTLAVVDMDSNTIPEIVCITYDRAYAFDLSDGRPRMFHYWNSGRCYAELVTKNIDADRHPELVIHACNLREHLSVLDNDGKNISFGWQHFYEQNYPHDKKSYTTCLDSVDDFDGDGEMEILQSLYNDTGDERWHTLVVDAITGQVKQDILDRRVEGVVQQRAGGPPAVLLTRTADRQNTNSLEVVWLDTGRTQVVSETGRLIKDTTRRNYPNDTAFSISSPISSRPLLPLGYEHEQFFIQEDRSVVEVSLKNPEKTLQKQQLVDLPAGYNLRLLNDVNGDGNIDAVLHSASLNRLEVVSGGESETLFSVTTGGPQTATVAARMHQEDQELTLLLVDGRARLQAWSSCSTNPQLAWEESIIPRRFPGGLRSVSILDIEGDGTQEILTGLADNRLAILDPGGNVIRQWQLNGTLHDWAFGNFTGDELTDLLVTTKPVSGGDEMSLFDLAEQSQVPSWTRDLATYYGFPAVVDANGDGIEDVALRYYFMRHVLDGRNGLDLYPVSWKQGQHCVSVVYPDGPNTEPSLLMSGGNCTFRLESFDGTEKWNIPFSDRYRPATVGDFDGDGKIDAASQTAGKRFALNPFRSLEDDWNQHICIWELASGKEVGRLALDGVCQGGLVSVDLDSDGRDEIVAGTDQGELLVLGIEGGSLQVESVLEFDATVGRPAIVDLQFDGHPEVVVSVEDGNCYLLKCRTDVP